MNVVFVINYDGLPLMPTRWVRAKKLIKTGKAVVIRHNPYTIKLNYISENKTQPVTLGIDPGYSFIGFSARTDKAELFSGTLEHEGAGTKIPNPTRKRLSEKAMYRRNRRSRLRHREKRFNNRVKNRKNGWIPPSINRKLQTHVNLVMMIKKILPVTNVVVEKCKFDIAKINNPDISGVEYQHGKLFNYINQKMYLIDEQGNRCPICNNKLTGSKIENHHIIPRSQGGSDTVDNLVCLHDECHIRLHEENLVVKKFGKRKRDVASTFMNVIKDKLISECNASYTYGSATDSLRHDYGIPKSHVNDAFIISGGSNQTRSLPYLIVQKRRNNRVLQTNNIKVCKTCKTGRRIRRGRNIYQSGDFVWLEKKMYNCYGSCGGRVVIGFKKSVGGYSQSITISPKKISKHFQNGSTFVRFDDGDGRYL